MQRQHISRFAVWLDKHDIWSVGVVGWELVEKDTPWGPLPSDMSDESLLMATSSAPSLYEKPRAMSENYFDFLKRALADVDTRISTFEAIRHPIFCETSATEMEPALKDNILRLVRELGDEMIRERVGVTRSGRKVSL